MLDLFLKTLCYGEIPEVPVAMAGNEWEVFARVHRVPQFVACGLKIRDVIARAEGPGTRATPSSPGL